MQPPEIFEKERLLLRRPKLSDAGAILEEYAQDPLVTRFLAWRPHQSIADTIAFLEATERHWKSGRRFSWALTRTGQDHVIGMLGCGVHGHHAEFGYVLGRRHWGQGLMVEAVAAVVDWLVAQPAIYRVWAVCDSTHLASARVLEKAGLEREGILRRFMILPNISPEPRDCTCYSRVREG
jgi:RimJ/RimL family protein N-acetyltransferase